MPRIMSIANGPGGRLCGLDEDGRLWRLMERCEIEHSDDGSWQVVDAGAARWELWPVVFAEEREPFPT